MGVEVCVLVCYIIGGVRWGRDVVSAGLWGVCGFMDGGS